MDQFVLLNLTRKNLCSFSSSSTSSTQTIIILAIPPLTLAILVMKAKKQMQRKEQWKGSFGQQDGYYQSSSVEPGSISRSEVVQLNYHPRCGKLN